MTRRVLDRAHAGHRCFLVAPQLLQRDAHPQACHEHPGHDLKTLAQDVGRCARFAVQPFDRRFGITALPLTGDQELQRLGILRIALRQLLDSLFGHRQVATLPRDKLLFAPAARADEATSLLAALPAAASSIAGSQ